MRLRLAIEELGPTYIKLGQILSTRADLLPPDLIDELRLLQDQVAPGPWEPIKELIESELDAPLNDLFAYFDPVPVASASLAQVYNATLLNGEEVVIKVMRPGIETTVNLDLDILFDFAQLAQERTTIGERYDAAGLADEFSNALRNELDFRREGRSADTFRENFAKEKQLYVPKVFWEYTTRRVMVQERITGIKIDNIPALTAAGYDLKRIANSAASLVLQEVLEDGFFHADPHPGNLHILPWEVLGVLDFGTMGRLETRDRVNLARLFVLVIQNDAEGIVDQLIRMGIADIRVDRLGLIRELRRLMQRYHGLPIQEIPATEVVNSLEPIIYKYNIRMPSDYWLLIKTIVLMQGVGLALDPEFDMFAASRPYLGRLFRQVFTPASWGPGLIRTVTDWSDLFSSFPRQTSHILDQLERGDFGVQVGVPQLDETINRLDRIANRIIYGILVAAMTVSLALLIPHLDTTWPWRLITWLIILGFLVMSFLSLWLIFSIIRSRRRRNRKK
jgi:ubiquinone biosynthesis protein